MSGTPTGAIAQAGLDSLPSQIAILDDNGVILMTNRAWIEFGRENGGDPAGPGADYLQACDEAGEDERATEAAVGLRAMLTGERTTFSMEYPCDGPSGKRFFRLQAAQCSGPGDARIVVAHDDVTERHRAQVNEAHQGALLDEIDVAVVTTDLERRILSWNRGAEQLYGWTFEEVAGRRAKLFALPTSSDEKTLAELLSEGRWEGEATGRRKDGSIFPVGFRCSLVLGSHEVPVAITGVSVDISERVAAERAALAARNHLRAVTDSIGEGLFTLDAEGCVSYMNAAAEQLLGWSADHLRGRRMHYITHMRRVDGAPSRIEDCPICSTNADDETVRVDDDVFIRRDGREVPVAYTAAPIETEDGFDGRVVVFKDISERKAHEENLRLAADKLAWIGRIQDALEDDRFELFAQPILSLESGAIVQHELLLRLRDPDGEIVAPGAFLEVAEQYGLIGDIDRWVVRSAITTAGAGSPVQINLSAQSMSDQGILDHIEACIAESQADPSLIVFEITETALVSDEAAARAFAERLHELGCKLALDDFGTGYGGFTHVKRLPVDFLKIDIEFVRDLETNTGSRHVVQAIVALAAGFKMQTIAEGVENAEVLELLRELGVDFAQGFHLGRPAPFEHSGPSRELTPIK